MCKIMSSKKDADIGFENVADESIRHETAFEKILRSNLPSRELSLACL